MKKLCILFICIFFTSFLFSQGLFQAIDSGKTQVTRKKNQSAINAFHKENMGKLLFTSERIPFKAQDAASLAEFEFGKTLFVREYWSKTMAEAYNSSFNKKANAETALLYVVNLDGIGTYQQSFYGWSGNAECETWFTNWFVAAKPGNEFENVFYTLVLENALSTYKSKLSGKVKATIQSFIYDAASSQPGEKMAEGTINIRIPDITQIPNPTKETYPTCLPQPGIKNSVLESTFVEVLNSQGWTEKFIRAVIHTDDYTIIRNNLTSIVEKRTLGASIASRKPNGSCMYQRFTLSQAHDGSGFSGKWKLDGVGDQFSIPCACLK